MHNCKQDKEKHSAVPLTSVKQQTRWFLKEETPRRYAVVLIDKIEREWGVSCSAGTGSKLSFFSPASLLLSMPLLVCYKR